MKRPGSFFEFKRKSFTQRLGYIVLKSLNHTAFPEVLSIWKKKKNCCLAILAWNGSSRHSRRSARKGHLVWIETVSMRTLCFHSADASGVNRVLVEWCRSAGRHTANTPNSDDFALSLIFSYGLFLKTLLLSFLCSCSPTWFQDSTSTLWVSSPADRRGWAPPCPAWPLLEPTEALHLAWVPLLDSSPLFV